MNTPVRWNSSSTRIATLQGKWREIQRGLRLTAFAYSSLLLLAVPGLLIVWLSQGHRCAWFFERPDQLSRQGAQLIGLCVAGLGAFLWFSLLLAGQWLCLTYSPQRYAAKELLFICALCIALGPTSLGMAQYLGGANPQDLFDHGLSLLIQQPELHAALLLQVGGALLVMVNLVVYTGFLRAVIKCLTPDHEAAAAVRYLWFAAFLIGATLGMLWTPRPEVLYALASLWVIALLWHITLINYSSRLIARVLPATRESPRPVEESRAKPYSGLHRYYIHVKPE